MQSGVDMPLSVRDLSAGWRQDAARTKTNKNKTARKNNETTSELCDTTRRHGAFGK